MSVNEPSPSPSGLPATGPGSPAGWSRRFAALLADWLLANVAAVIIAGPRVWDVDAGLTWLPLLCWFGLVWLGTAATGASIGQWMVGVRIIRLSGQRVDLVRAGIRTALILLILPPLVFDRDGRGLHDLATATAAVRGPGG